MIRSRAQLLAMASMFPWALLLAQADTTAIQWSGDERALRFLEEYPGSDQVIEGYRVQIFLGAKVDAVRTRQGFLLKHPDIPAYLSYLAPNFRIRVGDLRDRISAERLRHELKEEQPGCYVVQDRIEPPRLPEASMP
ncbi:MAG: SPOR domain-containing protein [Flavobacteriales bacterium]|nr:SPOR domain-containing protein [Flavobacteriales bacterium]